MPLRTVGGVLDEMGRIYRRCLNQKISVDEMAKLVLALDRIRVGRAQEAEKAANNGRPSAQTLTINFVSPSSSTIDGHVIDIPRITHDAN
jgi:hypothetical protein